MNTIDVKHIGEDDYDVTVSGGRTTNHRVTLSASYHRQLSSGSCSPEDLIKKSFFFLLVREPNTSILSNFDLKVITRYFPEFEEEIKRR